MEKINGFYGLFVRVVRDFRHRATIMGLWEEDFENYQIAMPSVRNFENREIIVRIIRDFEN